jgi:hypothetical protein
MAQSAFDEANTAYAEGRYEEAAKGYVYIRGGDISITASDDAIQAVTKVTVEGGSITASAKSNVINCDGEISVAKDVITEK